MWVLTMFSMIAIINNVLGDNPLFLMFVFVAIILILMILVARLSLSLRQTRAVLATRTEELLLTMQAQENAPHPSIDEIAEDSESEEQVLYGRLFVMKGLQHEEIPIYSEMFTIGRSEDENCDFIINKPFVSPKHCVIFHKEGSFSIKDLDSKNGVFINGERVPRGREVPIPIGSEIEITKEITLELWDPHTTIEFDDEAVQSNDNDEQGTGHIGEELEFKPLLDVRYIPDEDVEIDDSYSPI